MSTEGPITSFPASGLPNQNRHIIGHNPEGRSVFLVSDNGDHSAIMVNGAAAQNIAYSTNSIPLDLEADKDIKFAIENKVRVTVTHSPKLLEIPRLSLKPYSHHHLYQMAPLSAPSTSPLVWSRSFIALCV